MFLTAADGSNYSTEWSPGMADSWGWAVGKGKVTVCGAKTERHVKAKAPNH